MSAPCGTQAAYQRHRYHGEPVDDACQRASAADRRQRRRQAGYAAYDQRRRALGQVKQDQLFRGVIAILAEAMLP